MLNIEDGSGLSSADSYISLVDARIYAANYGYTLPEDDALAEISLRRAVAYLDLQERFLSGERLTLTQSLAWPRKNSYKYAGNTSIPSDAVPSDIKNAQVIAAEYYGANETAREVSTGQNVIEETVGPITTKYSEGSGDGAKTYITEVDDLLRPYRYGKVRRVVRG